MALDQRKVSLISEFLEESFVGCSVHNREDEDRVGQLYWIANDPPARPCTVYLSRVRF
jgi:hypothetical protein